ncbi:hypothetical protein [Kribbella sp. NPDC004875]|uniref:hypothetical protein n=1 Tax=Kribbella sp. NPDC004875 TaxID=3364107 RepID=UPI00367C92AF
MSRLFVLFGTGDWAPWCDPLFEELTVPGRHAAVVAAGQAENGPTVVDEYRRGAAERLARVGVPNVDVPLLSRSEADDPAATACLDNAAFLYVLGGGPRGQVAALRGSGFWRNFLDGTLPYVGSSGGAMLLGARYPASPTGQVDSGLAVFPNAVIAAHWNELNETWRTIFLDLAGSDLLIALDVDAALVGDGSNWVVHGPGDVHIRGLDGWRRYSAGTRLDLQLTPPAGQAARNPRT